MTAREALGRARRMLRCTENNIDMNCIGVIGQLEGEALSLHVPWDVRHRAYASMQLDGQSVEDVTAAETGTPGSQP